MLKVKPDWKGIRKWISWKESNSKRKTKSVCESDVTSMFPWWQRKCCSDTLHAPLSDHMMEAPHLDGSKCKHNNHTAAYWKMKNTLFKDDTFTKIVQRTAEDTFKNGTLDPIQRWEFFTFKVWQLDIKHSKEMKTWKVKEEKQITEEWSHVIIKDPLSEDEHVQESSDQNRWIYMEMDKGAFTWSRAKWLEEGTKTQQLLLFTGEKKSTKQ